MQCLQLSQWGGDLQRTEIPRPEPGSVDVVVEVEATGVGRTVAHAIDGVVGGGTADLPRVPGHELVGVVREAGDGVEGVDEGDRVAAYFHLACGHCPACVDGREPLCENHAGWVGIDVDGGYAEYARLPARNAIPLPDDLDPVAATAIPDAIATPYHVANQRANVRPGDEVLVLGAGGGVGVHMVQVADHFGGTVTAADLSVEKLDRCSAVGAQRTVNTAEESIVAAADRWGIRYDAVVDFTAEASLVEDALGLLAPRGTLVTLTGGTEGPLEVPPVQLIRGERSVVGSRYCSRRELHRAVELVDDGTVTPVVSERVGFDGVPDLLERIEENEVVGRGAMTPT